MHFNYHFLRRLTPVLEGSIKGGVVSECYSQEKNELIIRLEVAKGVFFIKAILSPSFACLSFPDDLHRARKNSVDLFPFLIGERVEAVKQLQYERSFLIIMSNGVSLLFKMHGNRSNVILFREDVAIGLFKNNLQPDWQLIPKALERSIDMSYENFLRHMDNLPHLYFTFGKIVWKHFEALNFSSRSANEQWELINDLLKYFEDPKYFVCRIDGKLTFSLLRMGTVIKEYHEPVSAVNNFCQMYLQQEAFYHEKSQLISHVRKRMLAAEAANLKAAERLNDIHTGHSYKAWADLLMANLHAITPGQDRIALPDFYHADRIVEIKLKKELTPQKNAAIYYTKAKKQQVELTYLQELLVQKEQEVKTNRDLLEQLEAALDIKSLRRLVGDHKVSVTSQADEPLPFHEFEHQGFRILVGKNAQSNDKLLQRYSYKDDLWLHAKDVAGSHVLIKYQAGKNFPKDVIERAAQLAGCNSKRKTDTLCPVSVTPRKYVRKRKGDPAGMVVVERENVILVEPRC